MPWLEFRPTMFPAPLTELQIMPETIVYPDFEFIEVSVAEGVGRMTLNRPHVLNALIPEMMGERQH